jgi:endonuclease/exonuclease/phosphatase family metal-dependent hydrolase
MGKYKEAMKVVRTLFYSLFHSVDITPQESNIEEKIVLQNKIKSISIKNEMTIISWNILRNYNKQKIEKTLKKIKNDHNPDIILLQEAPVYDSSSFWEDHLFSKFNLYYAPLHQVKKQDSFYNFSHSGQLTLSHCPFIKTKVIKLPSLIKSVLGKDHIIRRVALYTQLTRGNGSTIGIYNIHLENVTWPTGRKKQLQYLLDEIKRNNDDTVLIGGDFNTFSGRFFEKGLALLVDAGFENLYNSGFRLVPRLDYFFIKGAKGVALQLKGSGSDHQPIMVKVKF